MCVCVCVWRGRTHTCTHVSRIFLPSACTTHKMYKFWNLLTTDYKTQCTKGKECQCGLLQTSDFLQLIFPNVGTAADEWSASAMVTLTPGTYWTGGWVGSRASVEMMVRSSTPTRNWTHSCSPSSPQPSHYTASNTQLSPHSMEQQWLPFILHFRASSVFTGRNIIHWCNSKMETRVHTYIHTYIQTYIHTHYVYTQQNSKDINSTSSSGFLCLITII